MVHWEALRRWTDCPDCVLGPVSAGVDWIADRVARGDVVQRSRRDGAMAEWVVAAILADARRSADAPSSRAAATGRLVKLGDASGLRVLVLGFGSIGARCDDARRLRLRGDRRRPARARRVHGIDRLPDLLPDADVVVNLLPLTEATREAFAARELEAMRDGALRERRARRPPRTRRAGRRLRRGRIRAVLDVVEPEPLPADHPLAGRRPA